VLASIGEFAVALGKDFLVVAIEFVVGRDVADGECKRTVL